MKNPYTIVDELERRLAEWCGSNYCVAVESGTAAIFLSLQWQKYKHGSIGEVSIPAHTYPSVPCSIIHAGGKVKFHTAAIPWHGEYKLDPYPIFDAALRLKRDMYFGGFQCLSFHIKKHLPAGRGGAILLDDKEAYEWLKRARFDGRNPVPLQEDDFTQLGWNAYMEPANAARAIQLFEIYRAKYPEGADDLKVEEQGYPDLSKYPVYQQ